MMELLIEEYLRSTSILAQKISQDLDAAREAYQDLWDTLNEKEQKQVLDEAIIDPADVLKYSNIKNVTSNEYLKYGQNSQFSWFTRSQLNLFTNNSMKEAKTPTKKTECLQSLNINKTLAQNAAFVVENKAKENNLLNKIKNKVINLKIPATVEEKQNLVENKPNAPVLLKPVLSKPKTPPPPPPVKQVLSEKKALLSIDNDSDPDDIPKTGFDFLDNW